MCCYLRYANPENKPEQMRFKQNDPNSLAGPLSVLPNNLNGQARNQNLRKALDHATNQQASKVTDRLLWRGKAMPPSPKVSALAPIKPSTTLTQNTTSAAGVAMAVGIILQVGRSKILYKTIQGYLEEFAQ